MIGSEIYGMRNPRCSIVPIKHILLGALLALTSCAAPAEDAPPYDIQDGRVDQSTYLGWRVFHSTCHGCHGIDATGTSVAPDLVEKVKNLSPRDFSTKVLSRYRITISSEAAAGDDRSELREKFLQEVLQRERGDVLMPAWEKDPNVQPHVLDIYAYLRARADGVLSPGRPERQSESK